MSARKETKNDRLITLLAETYPDQLEQLQRLDRDRAIELKYRRVLIPKTKLNALKREAKALVKGAALKETYDGLFVVQGRIVLDCGEACVDDSIVRIAPDKGTGAPAAQKVINGLVKLMQSLVDNGGMEQFEDELCTHLLDSDAGTAFAKRIDGFWKEVEDAAMEFDDFCRDDLDL